jgi:hypothetical protein
MGEFRDTRALAVLSLRTTADGGIRHAWPASTPSFLFLFEGVQFGAFIFTADAEPLEPGDVERDVELLFWVPLVRDYAKPGAQFTLVYGDRVIGDGTILVVEEGDSMPNHEPPPSTALGTRTTGD